MFGGPAMNPIEAMDIALAGHSCELISSDGTSTELNVRQWTAPSGPSDQSLFLDHCSGPTLDVGCGAGRICSALSGGGVDAMGIDLSATAVGMANERGATAVHADVYADVPHAGQWQHALLADTNIGIGGDPVRLLRRLEQVVTDDGSILVEVEPYGVGIVHDTVRLRVAGRVSDPFAWSRVGADAVEDLAATAGLRWCGLRFHEGRYVATLTPGGG